MNLREKLVFFRQVLVDTRHVGAIFTTGPSACRALCSELRRRSGPQRILEVGCGTGPVTEEIVSTMSVHDRLTVCDINESFVEFVRRRFATEPGFMEKAQQVDYHVGDITEYEGENEFDLIISSIPFTILTGPVLRSVLDHYRYLLKPGGAMTYIEYAYLRDLREMLQPVLKNGHFQEVNTMVKDMLEAYEYRTELIRWNFLPAVVRSLRFDEAPGAEQAHAMRPDLEQRRVSAGPLFLASDGIPKVAALLAAGCLCRGRRGRLLAWLLGLFTAFIHRDPKRLVLVDRSLCLAAADGHVLGLSEVRHPRLGDQTWIRIETSVAPTDVHVNRSPVAGRVSDRWEEPGGSSLATDLGDNTSVYLVLETVHGRCAVAQRSAVPGGRIFTWCRQGELLTQGGRFGLTPLVGRSDIYLPKGSAEVLVQVGDRVIAGRTPVARFLESRDAP
jgi:phosphatidylserine decarboxylase